MISVNITSFSTLDDIKRYYDELKDEYDVLARKLTEKKENIINNNIESIERELRSSILEAIKYFNDYKRTMNEEYNKKYLELLENIRYRRESIDNYRNNELKKLQNSTEFARLLEINGILIELSKFIPERSESKYRFCEKFMSFRKKSNSEWLEMILKLLSENKNDKYVVKVFKRIFNYEGDESFSDIPGHSFSQEETVIAIAKESFDTDSIHTSDIGYHSSLSKCRTFDNKNDYIIYDRISYPIDDLNEYYNAKRTSIIFPDIDDDILKLIENELFQEYKESLKRKNVQITLKKNE